MHDTRTILQSYKMEHSFQSTFRLGCKPQFISQLHIFIWKNHMKLMRLSFPKLKIKVKYPNHKIVQKITCENTHEMKALSSMRGT